MPSAAPPVRSTTVLPLFSTCEATSAATFGRASKFAPIVPTGTRRSDDLEPVAEPPRAHLALERRQRRGLLERDGDRLHARVVQAQAVERPGIQPALGGRQVLGVGGEHVAAQLPDELRGGVQRLLHRGVLDA